MGGCRLASLKVSRKQRAHLRHLSKARAAFATNAELRPLRPGPDAPRTPDATGGLPGPLELRNIRPAQEPCQMFLTFAATTNNVGVAAHLKASVDTTSEVIGAANLRPTRRALVVTFQDPGDLERLRAAISRIEATNASIKVRDVQLSGVEPNDHPEDLTAAINRQNSPLHLDLTSSQTEAAARVTMEPSPALACYIRGCPNEFGMVDPKQLLYVCTADDIQCKAWLTAIPKVSLKDVDDKLCLCSLHFENGVNVGGDSLPTIFPPLPGTSEIITDDPLPPAPVVPPIRIKEEPVDDYEQTGPQSSELESSVNLDSLPAWEDEESSMEVDHVAGASAARRNSFIPPHKIKREIDDSNEAGTSSSTQDSTSVDDGSHFLQFVTSYVVKDEPHEDNAEVAAPPPGSGCGVVEIVQRSSAFEIQEEFGEILVENIKTEEEDPAESPTVPPPASLPSAPAVTIKTEPLDPDEVVTNGFGEPSTSHDQGCQADPSSTVLMPPGFISEPPAPSSVASGPTAFVAGNVGALTGDTGFVISEVYSVAGGQQECAEDKAHCPRCVNSEGKQVRDKSTCTNLPTRTVWTQTVEPDKRTVWTQVAQLGDLRMLTHRATQTDPWLERSPRLPKVTRRKRRYEDDDDPDKL